jgi:hypothetical protein
MTTLILAAGKGKRWDWHLNVPKHMIPIKGEPLIHRTQRMLDEMGVQDVHVVCRDESYVRSPALRAVPREIDRATVHPQEESRHLWNETGKTTILYGDMYYSEKLLSKIVNDPADDWKIYARYGGSKFTGKDYGEIFGWVMRPEHYAHIDAARNVAISYTENGLWWRCIGWEVYRIGVKQLPWHHCKEDVHMVNYDDESDDFDDPDDWDRWSELHPRLAF